MQKDGHEGRSWQREVPSVTAGMCRRHKEQRYPPVPSRTVRTVLPKRVACRQRAHSPSTGGPWLVQREVPGHMFQKGGVCFRKKRAPKCGL